MCWSTAQQRVKFKSMPSAAAWDDDCGSSGCFSRPAWTHALECISWDQCFPSSLWSSQSSVASFTSSHNSLEQVKDAHYHNRFPLVSEDGWHAQFIKTIASEEGNETPLFVLTVVCDFWPLLLTFSTTFCLILLLQYLA